MTLMAKTVCKNCKFFRSARGGKVWYDCYCSHPSVIRDKIQDPVTGKIGYGHKNDLGNFVITDTPFPNCRDFNHGNCEMFDAKN